jgi:hypothetical protein
MSSWRMAASGIRNAAAKRSASRSMSCRSPLSVWCITKCPNSCATLYLKRSPGASLATTMTGLLVSSPAHMQTASHFSSGRGTVNTRTPALSTAFMTCGTGLSGSNPNSDRVTSAAVSGDSVSLGTRTGSSFICSAIFSALSHKVFAYWCTCVRCPALMRRARN